MPSSGATLPSHSIQRGIQGPGLKYTNGRTVPGMWFNNSRARSPWDQSRQRRVPRAMCCKIRLRSRSSCRTGFADDVEVLALVFADMPKRRDSPQPSRSPIVMRGWSFMVPKSAATPAMEKIPVVSDLLEWLGFTPTPVTAFGANRRDNGAGFGIRTGVIISPERKMDAPVGAVFVKRPVGRLSP